MIKLLLFRWYCVDFISQINAVRPVQEVPSL